MKPYEVIFGEIHSLPKGIVGRDRDIQWLTAAQVVGIARDHRGQLELFLSGDELHPRTESLRAASQFHSWHRSDGEPLRATRLLLPPLGHFDQVGSLVCTELLRAGADKDLHQAFRATEPILDLALQRLEMSEASILGLAGELLLLDALTQEGGLQAVSHWDGWRRSARDFSWQGIGVEVKTTSRHASTHDVLGIHQIEPAEGRTVGRSEELLLVVSIGLQRALPSNSAFTIPMLVERIVRRLTDAGDMSTITDFLKRVSLYGSETGFGYDHATMANDAPFTSTFSTTFARAYDMADPDIRVLRNDDVSPYYHVDLSSVSFRINLPAVLSGENPVAGITQVAEAILDLT